MASRRDQLQSYQFLVQRVVSALVLREPDPTGAPFPRALGTAFASVMVAGLALAAVGIYGVIKPGGKQSWKKGAAVIVEKETGTRYVYRDGKLHPVTNYASALLIIGTHADTVSVSRNSLVGTARGPRLGIPNAPDAVPAKSRLLGAPWSLCSEPKQDTTGGLVTSTVLVVGREPDRGRRLGDRAVLVKDSRTNDLFLVWRAHRYPVTDPETVLGALALRQEPQVAVGGAWLNALAAGEALGPLPVNGRGTSSAALTGARVGQVFVVRNQGGDEQFYLALRDRLAPITQVQADLLLTAEATRAAYPGRSPDAIPLASADARSAPKSEPPAPGPERAPAKAPEMADVTSDSTAVCAAFAGPRAAADIFVDAAAQGTVGAMRTSEQTEQGTALADLVMVEPGWGAVVEAMQSPDASSGTLYLITDQGRRYAVGTPDVLGILGYPRARVTKLPASLIARIPEGPALDPAAATKPVGDG